MGGTLVKILHTKGQMLSLFMIMFLLGILYVNIFAKHSVTELQVFSEYFLTQYTGMDVDAREYLLYLTRIRLLPFILVLVLTFTKVRKISAAVTVFWTGFSGGILLSLAAMNMGIKGILLCIVGIFPHFLFYIPAYIVLLVYSWQYPSNQWNRQKTVFIAAAMLTGILTEAYINPGLVRGFLNLL